jgi:hypothetical protein
MKLIAVLALAGMLAAGPALAGKGDPGPSPRAWEIARTLVQLSDSEFETSVRRAAGEVYDRVFAKANNPDARQAFVDLTLQAMQQVKGRMLDDSVEGLARGLTQDELEQYLAFQEIPAVARLREHQEELKAAYARSEADGQAYLANLLTPAEQGQVSAMLRDPAYLGLQAKVKKLSANLAEPPDEPPSETFAKLMQQACGSHPDYPWCAEPGMSAQADR